MLAIEVPSFTRGSVTVYLLNKGSYSDNSQIGIEVGVTNYDNGQAITTIKNLHAYRSGNATWQLREKSIMKIINNVRGVCDANDALGMIQLLLAKQLI